MFPLVRYHISEQELERDDVPQTSRAGEGGGSAGERESSARERGPGIRVHTRTLHIR